MKGWHFCNSDHTLGWGDGRVMRAGESLEVEGEPVLCEHGLHASARPLDALRYAPGGHVAFVELRGTVIMDIDKAAANERYVYWIADGESKLREFSRWCALQCAYLWDPPKVVLDYLHTGDDKLRDSARDSARVAARTAARDSSWDAARAAAQVFARDSAWTAAWESARAAARAAAWDSARASARVAAWTAAWDSAWDSARATQNDKLEALLKELAP